MTIPNGNISGVLLRACVGIAGIAATAFPCAAQTCADHGVPTNGFPTWQERATLVLTNAVRIAPTQYRTTFLPTATGILQPSIYPAVAPVQWNMGLNQSSRIHSFQMANTPGCTFAHNSCDGTLWNVRIGVYYPVYSALGENIAAGYADPLSVVNGWLLDTVGSAPAADNSGSDGHRRNIMSSSFTQLGCGYASGPNTYGNYWTQDFGRPPTGTGTICSPIAAGSHIIQTGTGGGVSFLMNYYDAANATPQSVNVVIDGASTPMSIYLGAAARGTYRLLSPTTTGCRSYHFEARDLAGMLYRYPARGELRTFGEGDCNADYVAASTSPPCTADFDSSGTLTTADIFTFLNAWFAGTPSADFNHVGGLTTQDIFDFLNAWFAGC
jgi:uncharacterized protein YkwD